MKIGLPVAKLPSQIHWFYCQSNNDSVTWRRRGFQIFVYRQGTVDTWKHSLLRGWYIKSSLNR